MKRILGIVLVLGVAGSVVAMQGGSETLVISGPYYMLATPSGGIYTISGPPGTYQTAGMAVTPGLSSANVLVTITIPAPAPPGPTPPTPAPGPVPPTPPKPEPVPITGNMWMLFVADTSSAPYTTVGSFQARLWGSTTIGPALAAPPIFTFWRHYDSSDPLLNSTRWGKVARQAGFPCLLSVDQQGNATAISPLPTDEAGVIVAAQKARGLP